MRISDVHLRLFIAILCAKYIKNNNNDDDDDDDDNNTNINNNNNNNTNDNVNYTSVNLLLLCSRLFYRIRSYLALLPKQILKVL